MARERSTTIRCAAKSCTETKFHLYTSKRDYDEIWDDQHKHPWKCSRHDKPEQVLRPDNPTTEVVLIASKVRAWKSEEFLDGLFWLPEGGTSGSGFISGPGFKAHAGDFPEGTRLIVTTRIEVLGEPENAGLMVPPSAGELHFQWDSCGWLEHAAGPDFGDNCGEPVGPIEVGDTLVDIIRKAAAHQCPPVIEVQREVEIEEGLWPPREETDQ